MFDPFEIEKLVKAHLPGASVEVRDMTGGGDHFEIEVASPAFQNKSLLEQHRLVHSALGDALSGPIHAVQIKTKAI